jgi:hypothetical protein
MYKSRHGGIGYIDTHVAEDIAEGNFLERDQLAIGKEVAGMQRSQARDFIRKVKSYKDKPVSEAIRKAKRIPETISYFVSFDLKTQRALQKYAIQKDITVVEVIRKATEQYLKRGGYL